LKDYITHYHILGTKINFKVLRNRNLIEIDLFY
jgi:hypothetical protein